MLAGVFWLVAWNGYERSFFISPLLRPIASDDSVAYLGNSFFLRLGSN